MQRPLPQYFGSILSKPQRPTWSADGRLVKPVTTLTSHGVVSARVGLSDAVVAAGLGYWVLTTVISISVTGLNNRRRKAAVLPKMRCPATTMIAVANCVPDAQLVTGTARQPLKTLNTNETTKTFGSKRSARDRRASYRTPREVVSDRRRYGWIWNAGMENQKLQHDSNGERRDPRSCAPDSRPYRSHGFLLSGLLSLAQSVWRT